MGTSQSATVETTSLSSRKRHYRMSAAVWVVGTFADFRVHWHPPLRAIASSSARLGARESGWRHLMPRRLRLRGGRCPDSDRRPRSPGRSLRLSGRPLAPRLVRHALSRRAAGGRAGDCMARMMRQSKCVRSPSDAALLLIGHPGSCLDRRRGRACLLLALVGGPTKDQPLPAVVRCREAATGRSPG